MVMFKSALKEENKEVYNWRLRDQEGVPKLIARCTTD